MWKRHHQLNRMSLGQLIIAFVQYPAVWAYVGFGAVATALSWSCSSSAITTVLSIAAAMLVYPLVWYALHRWVLHGKWMFKSPLTAGTWKRIHYDHHMDPNDLRVLFGALFTTLPTIALSTIPLGAAIGGFGAAMAALAAGTFMTCVYEFIHCVEHLPYKPRNRMLARMKALHLSHHFHDEKGNFGITNFWWDRLLGTLYQRSERPAKSMTVFNLGYDDDSAHRYPWVKQLSHSSTTPKSD